VTERGTQNMPRKVADAVRRREDTQPWRYSLDTMIAGHVPEVVILPVEIVNVDLGDRDLTPETRSMRAYPGRLRRLSQKAHDDVMALVGTGR